MTFNLRARLTAEFVGSGFLVAAVIGSGIMGERLAGGNVAMALLANTIATGAALVALIWCPSASSGHPRRCNGERYSLARGSGVHACAVCGRRCGSDHCTPDVRVALVFALVAPSARMDAGSERVCGNIRTSVGDLGMFATTLRSGAVRRCELYHCCLLVHRVNLVCKPSSDNCPLFV
jgi:hypothetical protein